MIAKFNPLPNPWSPGSQRQVTVEITGAPPGQTVDVTLYQTVPSPKQELDSKRLNVTGAGEATAAFSVTLSLLGINVLHCEAQSNSGHDSDSAGTVVQ
jgi:hypothetical protein